MLGCWAAASHPGDDTRVIETLDFSLAGTQRPRRTQRRGEWLPDGPRTNREGAPWPQAAWRHKRSILGSWVAAGVAAPTHLLLSLPSLAVEGSWAQKASRVPTAPAASRASRAPLGLWASRASQACLASLGNPESRYVSFLSGCDSWGGLLEAPACSPPADRLWGGFQGKEASEQRIRELCGGMISGKCPPSSAPS